MPFAALAAADDRVAAWALFRSELDEGFEPAPEAHAFERRVQPIRDCTIIHILQAAMVGGMMGVGLDEACFLEGGDERAVLRRGIMRRRVDFASQTCANHKCYRERVEEA